MGRRPKADGFTDKQLVAALVKANGFYSAAARALGGVHWRTIHRRVNESAEMLELVASLREGVTDFAEAQLLKKIRSGDTTAIIFYLKTRGRDRGYSDRIGIDANVNVNGSDAAGLCGLGKIDNDELDRRLKAAEEKAAKRRQNAIAREIAELEDPAEESVDEGARLD